MRVLTRALAGLMALVFVPWGAFGLFTGHRERYLWTTLGGGIFLGVYALTGWAPKGIRNSRVMGWVLGATYALGVAMLFPEMLDIVGNGWGRPWRLLAAAVAAVFWPVSTAIMILRAFLDGPGH